MSDTAATEYPFILPEPNELTQPWWDAVRRHELVIQRCTRCQTLRHPPQSVCAQCGGESHDWRTVTASGSVYSFVIVHRATLPRWKQSVPYDIIIVALDDDPEIRLYGNLVDPPTSIEIGSSVAAVFDDVTPTDTILRWRLTGPPA